MSSPDPKADLRLARAFAAKHIPWFAPALYRCNIVLNKQVSVAAIDTHYNVYWNPDVVNLITSSTANRTRQLEELAFIWVHEISHNLRNHNERRVDLGGEPTRWNCCADMEINDSNWEGTRHPTLFPPVLPKTFNVEDGQLAEWYYRKEEVKIPPQMMLDCGSGAHGQDRAWELTGEGQNLTDTQREIIQRNVAKKMQAAPPGTIPGHWQVWINHTLNPKVDWRQLLRQRLATAIAVGSGGRVDYSYRRPGRRQSTYDPVIMPTLTGTTRNQLAVVVDTSGSMGGGLLDQAIAELYGILQSAHQQVTLIPCDATDYAPIQLSNEADLRRLVELPGGGGTNMIGGIEAALQLKPTPDTVLVLTDGYTPYPMETYATPVLFGIIGKGRDAYNWPPNPPWGEDTVVGIGNEG